MLLLLPFSFYLYKICARQVHNISIDTTKLIENISKSMLKTEHGFLGEYISNAIDANTRLVTETNNPDADLNHDIHITITSDGKQFTIRDYGCGMTKEDLLKNLTRLGSSSNTSNQEDIIGKYGWGFFSAFAESDHIDVCTRKVGHDIMYKLSLKLGDDGFMIEEEKAGDSFKHGTQITVFMKDEFKVYERDVAKWVSHNLIDDSRFKNYCFKILKSDDEIARETEEESKRVLEERNRLTTKKENLDKEKKEKNEEYVKLEEKKLEKVKNKAEKEIEGNEFDKIDDNKVDGTESDKKEEVKDESEKVDEIVKLDEEIEKIMEKITKLDEQIQETEKELDNLHENEINPERILDFCPWTKDTSEDTLKKIYETRYNKKDFKLAKPIKFSIVQIKDKTKIPVEFEGIVFIPQIDQNMMGMEDKVQKKGEFEVFVQGRKVCIPSIESEFLKPFSFIVKSNQALLSSTREEFLDHVNTVESLKNRLIKKTVDIFSDDIKKCEEINAYSKIIKSGYFEMKREEMEKKFSTNTSILEKLSEILTFESNLGLKTLKKFYEELNKIKEKKAKKTENKKSEGDEVEGENDNKEKDEDNKTENDVEDKNEENNKDNEKNEEEYGDIDAIYYTDAPKSLVVDIKGPLVDGINVPFLLLNDIHDEQILGSLKNFKGYNIKNINTKKFLNKIEIVGDEKLKYTKLISTIKEALTQYISNVIISRRLMKLPFSILVRENSMSAGLRSVIGENNLNSNPFRSMFDPKPDLEINVDSKELIEINKKLENAEDIENIKNSILLMFIGTSIACRVDLYEKGNGYIDLMNIGRNIIGLDKSDIKYKSADGMFGGMDMFSGMNMNNENENETDYFEKNTPEENDNEEVSEDKDIDNEEFNDELEDKEFDENNENDNKEFDGKNEDYDFKENDNKEFEEKNEDYDFKENDNKEFEEKNEDYDFKENDNEEFEEKNEDYDFKENDNEEFDFKFDENFMDEGIREDL